MTLEQFNVLRILKSSQPDFMSQKDILKRMVAPNSNLTLIIKKLVDKNLVKVDQSAEDKRAYEISLTEDGILKLNELDEHIKSKRGNFSPLSESEAFHLNALLDKIRD